ncbi:peptidase [Flavobacteriales bacterium 34_180_T64]|nr:peptidase [Flavobacteriales bacterium 34_180_T64]
MKHKRKHLAKKSRWYRKLHRFIAVPLVLFMFILGLSGLLLTWKNQLQFKPQIASINTTNLTLISLDKIRENAIAYAENLDLSSVINRIDYRPSKGIAKVRFESHFTELQINCFTGDIVAIENRSDTIIEMIHDGSILDFLFKNESKPIKLVYSTLTSLGLMLLSFSGFWLWKKPKQLKKLKA